MKQSGETNYSCAVSWVRLTLKENIRVVAIRAARAAHHGLDPAAFTRVRHHFEAHAVPEREAHSRAVRRVGVRVPLPAALAGVTRKVVPSKVGTG